jgi:HopA1 effector protein family
LVRFYFNLKPEYVVAFIEKLCYFLDRNNVQFSIKCFKNIKDYSRADNTVLYVYKYEWEKYYDLIKKVISESNFFLNHPIPLFTYPLAKGVGFGENPKEINSSFGLARCSIIAEEIIKNRKQTYSKEYLFTKVLIGIQQRGYNTGYFYLNPRSVFPYDFKL